MKDWPALITGIIFGAGLALSGMTDTDKVLGFLDLAGDWDPDLMFVMGGALLVTLGATPLVLKQAKPLLAEVFALPVSTLVDRRLLGGGVLFGLGLGAVGLLPGAGNCGAGLRLRVHHRFHGGHAGRYVAGRGSGAG